MNKAMNSRGNDVATMIAVREIPVSDVRCECAQVPDIKHKETAKNESQ
jgi:hypothetical protein